MPFLKTAKRFGNLLEIFRKQVTNKYQKMPKKTLQTSHEGNVNVTENVIPTSKTSPAADDGPNLEISDIPISASRQKIQYLKAPVKSQNDKKDYRVIRLENGLTALLISDVRSLSTVKTATEKPCKEKPCKESSNASCSSTDTEEYLSNREDDDDEDEEEEEDDDDDDGVDDDDEDNFGNKQEKRDEKMAACALCVGVGSFSDPVEIPGMAHFLEHMVFMGSEKYPRENDFDSFIKKHGGSDNASTECEYTTFYFEVQEKYLLDALDRFAQFFINPLMKRDAISREREAVESEFQMALPSDFYRKEQLFCSFARPNHPAQKFTWGNLVTLRDNIADDVLYDQLHKFRERHYSAHRMSLAIQARLPLDTLEEFVASCFSHVPNNGLPVEDFTPFKGISSFDSPNFKKIYRIKPTKDTCQVELTWTMPPLHDLYKSKPHQYVSWIIGHEGKGSLISYLRKKMWCLDIFSGNGESGFEHSSMYALFSLSLILTDEGHEHLKEVLDTVFSYINLMKKEGPQKRIFDEIQQIEETNFRFTDEDPAVEYVESMCENMHFYAPEDYITGSELYFEYNPEAIEACVNYLLADNVNIIIFDKKFDDQTFEKVEPWFKTRYTDSEIPKEWVEGWKTMEILEDFHLPLPNIFISTDFNLISLPSDIPDFPERIHSDPISEIWYRPDPKFAIPECYMYFYLISPLGFALPQNAAMMDLFICVLKQLLIEELYPATAAELNHKIYTSDKGIVIKVNGFSQKLPLLLRTITKYIVDCADLMTEDLFNVMKKEQLKSYYNTFLKPMKLAKDVRLSILILANWSTVERHAALSGVDFQQFRYFVKHFCDHLYIQSLVQGNITKNDVIEHVGDCIKILNCGPLLPNTMPRIRVNELPVGDRCCRVANFNATDANSVVTNYYQSGPMSLKTSVIIELLIMIMEEPLFNQLRTQEQLGYNVFCMMRDTFGILGYSITVCSQADKYTTEYLDKRIEAFVKDFIGVLHKMTDEELDSVKEALIKLKRCVDIHLKDEVDRNWSEIVSKECMFDRQEREIAVIERTTLQELEEWLDRHTVRGENFRKLTVQIVGNLPKNQVLGKEADNNVAENEVLEKEDDNNVTKNDVVAPKLNEERTAGTQYGGDVRYAFQYLTNAEKEKTNKPPNYFITNVEDYKQSLYVYPLHRKS